MRAFIVILLMAVSVHAQSLADAARKERERRAHLKSAEIIKAEGNTSTAPAAGGTAVTGAKAEEGKKPEEAAAASAKPAEGTPAEGKTVTTEKATDKAAASDKPKEPPKPQAPAIDPTKEWNDQLQRLRAKIQALQQEEASVQLQINEINNQIYAPVVDQATKDQALARVGEARQRLETVRLELDQTRKTLESTQLQGPAKK